MAIVHLIFQKIITLKCHHVLLTALGCWSKSAFELRILERAFNFIRRMRSSWLGVRVS